MLIFNCLNVENLPLVIHSDNKNENTFNQLCELIQDNKSVIHEKLNQCGGVLFRGFEINNITNFKEVCAILFGKLSGYEGGDSPRNKIIDDVYTSTHFPSEYFISMHNEKSYSNNYPQYIAFYCEQPALAGGETPLLDGRKLYRLLDKKIIQTFGDNKLKYIQNLSIDGSFGRSWCEIFETSDKRTVENYLIKNKIYFYWKKDNILYLEEVVDPIVKHPKTDEYAFFSQADQWHPSNLEPEVYSALKELFEEKDFYHHCMLGNNEPIDVSMLQVIRELSKRELVTFKWEKNDVLFLDNLITLHGRFPFSGERKVFTAMA